jgi:hypothetical protein
VVLGYRREMTGIVIVGAGFGGRLGEHTMADRL